MKEGTELKKGDVVQLTSDPCGGARFSSCFMTVTEVREWGATGYVTLPIAGAIRTAKMLATWHEMELIGRAHRMIE